MADVKRNECKQIDAESLRSWFLIYTRRAFKTIPEIENPEILDIGCGSGIPTMELARLSKGKVLGIDIDKSSLHTLEEKIRKAELSDRITTMKCSVKEMDFEDETFDIVWSDAIQVVGFKKGIKEWRRLIKPNGFLVIHDSKIDFENKLESICESGYKLLDYFIIDRDIWFKEYFLPLSEAVDQVRKFCKLDSETISEIEKYQNQLNEFEKNPELNESVFFIMQKV